MIRPVGDGPAGPDRDQPTAAYPARDILNALTTIKARAQITRRRVLRVDALNREHIAADLALIEAQATVLTELLQRVVDADADPREPHP